MSGPWCGWVAATAGWSAWLITLLAVWWLTLWREDERS